MMTALRELRRYPSALVGLALILTLAGMAIYGVIAIPYNEALRLWRGGEDIWIEYPRNAQPGWVNLFPGNNLPKTIVLGSREGGAKRVEVESGELKSVQISLGFDYRYDDFPSELNLFFDPKFRERPPHVSLFWLTPDGRRLTLGDRSVGPSERYAVSLDQRLAEPQPLEILISSGSLCWMPWESL